MIDHSLCVLRLLEVCEAETFYFTSLRKGVIVRGSAPTQYYGQMKNTLPTCLSGWSSTDSDRQTDEYTHR